jgi:hypothetical protein
LIRKGKSQDVGNRSGLDETFRVVFISEGISTKHVAFSTQNKDDDSEQKAHHRTSEGQIQPIGCSTKLHPNASESPLTSFTSKSLVQIRSAQEMRDDAQLGITSSSDSCNNMSLGSHRKPKPVAKFRSGSFQQLVR